jgi:parvulin-like peptidyl-prolyl isomerase
MQLFEQILSCYGWEGAALAGATLLMLGVQLYYYIFVYGRIPGYKNNRRPQTMDREPPVSVVVPLFSEDYSFVEERLPLILAQNYPDFEVVIVYVGHDTDFYEDLVRLKQSFPQITTTKIHLDPRFPISRKMALNVGIKSAHYECMVFTSTDAVPQTDRWLSLMAKGFMRGEIVVGYCGVERGKGFSNYMMRAWRMMHSADWIARAVQRRAYRGTLHNYGFTKSLYFGANGFSHLNMNIGEDDLFMQRVMTRDNVSVILSPRASLREKMWGGMGWWTSQLRYFGSAFRFYPRAVKTFVRANRNGKIADSYVSAAQLSDEEAKALMAGEMYGPVLKNNEWTMSRALDSKMVPDSVGVRHIVLPYAQEALADSLLTVLKKGGDFAQTAARYSVYDATAANGGEVGVLPFSAFTGEFAAALANARQGDIVKIASGDAIQLMQVYRADKPSKHVQVATITYPVEASAATRRDVHNQAGSFMVNAKGSAAAFADAASTAAVTPRVAAIAQGDRTIRGLEDSREVARWAYGAKEGDLSAIFNVGKDYVIATLTEIDDNEYAPLNKVSAQIRSQLLRDKKYDYIVKSLSGSTLAEQAASLGSEVEDFSDVTFGSFYVNGVGMEPRLVGAIASAEKGALSAPVKGLSGVYVFEVGDVKTDDKQTAEGEKVRAQAMAEGMAQQFAIPAIQQMAKIQDLRGKYF